jgi:ATP-dependent exoDNAse (exonuclease V) alpha subunit
MALFHLNVSSIGKAAGSSAIASAAYRSCSLLNQSITDSNTGLVTSIEHNFSNKKGLAFSQIFAPKNLDEWCYDREKLWNKVEATETHIKGRYARVLKLALQIEFSLEQNIQVLSEYIENVFVKDGIIADVNIHMDDLNNPHAHIMLTTRNLEQNDNGEWVFRNKKRLLDSNGWLVYIRSSWSEINNKYFAIHGIDKTITHESYKDRGLDFVKSTIHEGAARHTETAEETLERPEYNRNVIVENLHYIKSNPIIVIQTLSKNISADNGVFSRNDLYKAVDRFLDEIASRGEDAKILVEEARAAIYSQCDEMFKDINHFDLSLDKVFELSANLVSSNGQISANNLQAAPIIQENIISLIEEFSKKAGNKLNISDELEFIRLNPDKLIEMVSKKQAVFGKLDLAKALDAHINEAIFKEIGESEIGLLESAKAEILEKYDALLVSFKDSEEMVKLVDSDIAGKEVYTTKSQLSLEKEFIGNIESLAKSTKHSLNLESLSPNKPSLTEKLNNSLAEVLTPSAAVSLEKIVASIFGTKKTVNLSDEQGNAVMRLINGNDIVCLRGMPGTGKSTVMAKLAKEYSKHGYEVVGAATSAVAALNLGTEAGINSYTLSKLQHDWELRSALEEKGEDVKKLLPYLSSKNIMIIDEMSMVDLTMFNYMVAQVIKAGAKLITVGDNNRLCCMNRNLDAITHFYKN